MDKKIYVGLDVGTNSVGWAVTDGNYNIKRLKGKDLWGVRKFEDAKPAEERRMHRASRRNLQRRKQRITYLNEIFEAELNKKDSDFLRSLRESQLYYEDKSVAKKHTLFNDADFTDKDFHEKYKTINHLIVDLIDNGTDDIRLLYLGVHKLLKNRGHFLFENLKTSVSFDATDGESLLTKLNADINNAISDECVIDFRGKEKDILTIIKRKDTLRNKNREILALLEIPKLDECGKQKTEIIKAIVGSKARMSVIFDDESIKENFEDDQFEVGKENLDDILEDAVDYIEIEGKELLSTIKMLNDWAILSGILGKHKLISYGMKEMYETHKKDLKELKEYIRASYSTKDYFDMFKNYKDKIANYVHYSAHSKAHNKKQYTNNVSQEDFGKYVKRLFKDDKSETALNIIQRIDSGSYMPKQVSKLNAAIPNQLRKEELRLILEKNKANFPFLQKIDSEHEVSNIDKLMSIITFRIPYFVGPLNDKHKVNQDGFAWIRKRKGYEHTKVTPWNFDKIVDKTASNLAFLENLVGECTYLSGEKVLPKHSLLNSKHAILSAINKIKINNVPIDVGLKQQLFYFLINERKITRKTITDFFVKNGHVSKSDVALIEPIDVDFNMSYPAFSKIKTILNDKVDYNDDFEILENIILWATQSTNAKMLREKIEQAYTNRFSKLEIDKLSSLKFDDWARLSKSFLSKIVSTSNKETGEVLTMEQALFVTNYNLQELIDNEYNFKASIKAFNDEYIKNTGSEISLFDKVKDLYASAPVKRQIWQTLLVLDDLKKVLPTHPDKIFIEMARGGNDVKERTVSRKNKLISQYKESIKDEKRNWVDELTNTADSIFRSDKAYLYYTQNGKCAYSGETINLADLFNVNLYDVDHIYPRSKIKDDSLNNKVLVKKKLNMEKGDELLSSTIRQKMEGFWRFLLSSKLIEQEKFNRLTRSNPLTRDECTDFINRQLVETRQSTKLIGSLIEEVYPKSKLVYSKARNIRDFKEFTATEENNKKRFDEFVKVREVNDLHHAKDAYLNIVVGNVYNTKFGYNARQYFEKNDVKSYNLKYMFANNLKNAWSVDKNNNSFETVKRNFDKNSCLVTEMTVVRNSGFYDEQLKRKSDKKGKYMPIKDSTNFLDGKLQDDSKYGGYGGVKNSYLVLLKYKKGKKQIKRLEFVPSIVVRKSNQGQMLVVDYFKELLDTDNVEILIDKIPIKSLFKINGTYVSFTGKTGTLLGWNNANQLLLNKVELNYLKKITNYNRRVRDSVDKSANSLKIEERHDYINKDKNLELYDVFTAKFNSKVYNNLPMPNHYNIMTSKRDTFISLSVEDQSIFLYEALKLFQANAAIANFSLINGAKKTGNCCSSQLVDFYDEIKLIKQSPTGLFEKIIDLKQL